jgi:hypothetical protein
MAICKVMACEYRYGSPNILYKRVKDFAHMSPHHRGYAEKFPVHVARRFESQCSKIEKVDHLPFALGIRVARSRGGGTPRAWQALRSGRHVAA